MKRILLTGMSGTGKSTVITELAARGCKAIDADCAEFSMWAAVSADSSTPGTPVEADRDWVWRADRMQELLSTEDAPLLFVSGCAPNMGQFLPQFDQVILLSAPAAVIVARLATRTTNTYGQRPEEVARVLGLIDEVEPLLRRVADYEIDTSAPLNKVIAAVLHLAHALA